MGIEDNKEALQMMQNTLGSLENRMREAYNKGYKDGLKEGIDQTTKKLVDKILEEVEADRKTENSSEKPNNCEDEPQTELVNDSPILAKDLVNDEFNPYDEECMRCKHLKLQCEFVPSYCKYEPRDDRCKDIATTAMHILANALEVDDDDTTQEERSE